MNLEKLTASLQSQQDTDAVRRRNNSYARNAQGQLIALSLSGSEIEEIEIGEEAQALEYLYLAGNQKLKKLSFIGALPSLQHLNVSECSLNGPIHLPAGFSALEQIYFRNNQLSAVTMEGSYPSLKLADLSKNQLESFAKPRVTPQLAYLYLQGNSSIATPPLEIAKQGSDAVLNWYSAEKKDFREVKVLLIGDAKVGKTSVLRRLKDNHFDPEEPQTDGIIIEKFDFEHLPAFSLQAGLKGIKAYFWDFGGQEILSATHEFFMTKRSIYLLVLEARKDANADDQVRHWMRRIQAFGGQSQVIIVANKIDIHPAFGIDANKLKKEFPQIKDFLKVSCETEEGLDKLRNSLEQFIPKAELCSTSIDERWIGLKDTLQAITDKDFHLSQGRFKIACRHNGLSNPEEQQQAIKFLNDLGILLHFDEFGMRDFYVLDPLWVTSGVYRIITSNEVARQEGIIQLDQLHKMVNKGPRNTAQYLPESQKTIQYGDRELEYLAKLMTRFKLGYFTNTNGEKSLLIPSLLDVNTPIEESEQISTAENTLRFHFEYDYLPESILPNLMVELNEHIFKQWRSGMILHYQHNTAQALITSGNKKIKIIVTGEYKQKREFLSIIRNKMYKINGQLQVKVDSCIPLPGYYDEYCVDYEVLLEMEMENEDGYYTEYQIKDRDKRKFPLRKLLDGIEKKEALHHLEHRLEAFEQKMLTRFDQFDEKLDDLLANQHLVIQLIEEGQYTGQQLNQMQDALQRSIEQNFSNLPEVIQHRWRQIKEEIQSEDEVRSKFKIMIPIIPTIMEYEMEVDWEWNKLPKFKSLPAFLKEAWHHLSNGKVFTYEE